MMIPRSLASLPLALGAAVLLGACGSDVSPTQDGTGTIVVKLTDAPFPFELVEKVEVHVVRVDAKREDVSEAQADADTDDDDKNRGGWVTIAEPDAVIDLLTLRDGVTTNLGQQTIQAGTWRAFRLIIDPALSKVTLKDGTNPDVQWPSAGRSGLKVQLDKSVTIDDGESAEVVIDFDVGESFVMRGNSIQNNGLLFKPVIRATVVDAPAPAAP